MTYEWEVVARFYDGDNNQVGEYATAPVGYEWEAWKIGVAGSYISGTADTAEDARRRVQEAVFGLVSDDA